MYNQIKDNIRIRAVISDVNFYLTKTKSGNAIAKKIDDFVGGTKRFSILNLAQEEQPPMIEARYLLSNTGAQAAFKPLVESYIKPEERKITDGIIYINKNFALNIEDIYFYDPQKDFIVFEKYSNYPGLDSKEEKGCTNLQLIYFLCFQLAKSLIHECIHFLLWLNNAPEGDCYYQDNGNENGPAYLKNELKVQEIMGKAFGYYPHTGILPKAAQTTRKIINNMMPLALMLGKTRLNEWYNCFFNLRRQMDIGKGKYTPWRIPNNFRYNPIDEEILQKDNWLELGLDILSIDKWWQ